MPLSNKDLWRLAIQGQLLTPDQGKLLAQRFASLRGSGTVDDAKVLGEWLVSENAISRYQLKVLLAGRAGPFQFGDYQVYDRIGSGTLKGMFRALHGPTRHSVLLAFVDSKDAGSGGRWAAIAADTQQWSRTSHPNVFQVYEPVDIQTHKFVVFEDFPANTTASLIEAGPRASAEAAQWAMQAASGLSHLHRAELFHGDIRPSQLFVNGQGVVKVFIDPRRARTAPRVDQSDPTGDLLARANYFAPEFSSGRKLPDAKTDIYALGASLYELLSGRPPFTGGDVTEKMQRHANEAVQPLPASVPQALGQLVNFMMAKNVDVRYQEATHVVEQLRPFAGDAPQTPAPAETLAPYLSHIKQKQAELAAAESAARPAVVTEEATSPGPSISTSSADEGGDAAATGAKSRSVRRKKRTDKTAWIIGGVCAAVAAMVAIIVISQGGGSNQTAQNNRTAPSESDPGVVNNVSDNSPALDGAPANGGAPDSKGGSAVNVQRPTVVEEPVELIDDDGESLWGSPTSGESVSLANVPLGGIAFVSSRPASMLSFANGRRTLQAMGPVFQQNVAAWQKRAGVVFRDVDSLLITFHENGDKFPRPSYVVRLTTPRPKAELIAAWKASEVNGDSGGYFKSASDSFYIPASETDDSVRVFTMGSEEDIKDVTQRRGAPPTLRKGLADLVRTSDSDRHVNVFFTPFDVKNRFFHAGRKMYFGTGDKLSKPLDWFFGGELNAAATSMHVDDNLSYLEIRLANNLSAASLDIAERLRDRIDEIHPRLEKYMRSIQAPDYWDAIAFRLPTMFLFVHEQSRVQVDQGMAMINAALPPMAAHNLVFGCEMALASQPGLVVASGGPAKPAGAVSSVEEMLERPMSLSFDQLSLEFAMAQVQADAIENHKPSFDFKVTIVGADLQLNGITRNFQVKEFSVRDQPIKDILTAIVMKANPITTVKSPDELDQKLIWVVASDEESILITTRDAATAKNYTLPKVFQPK